MKIVLLLQHLQRYESIEHPHATCYNLFFAGVVKSSAFCTLCLQFWMFRFPIAKNNCEIETWNFQLKIAGTMCKKHWIWQLLQKIEQKFVLDLKFSDKKNDSLSQKFDLNLAFHFNHSQPTKVCIMHTHCALCMLKISQEMVIIPIFHHQTSFFLYSLVKNMIF